MVIMLVVLTGVFMPDTLQGTTVCTKLPTWIDETVACPTPILEDHMAAWTHHVVGMDPLPTTRTVQPVLEFLKQAFLFK